MPIIERPLLGLLRVMVYPTGLNGLPREITGELTNVSYAVGSSLNGVDLNADVGTFTITLKDTRGKVWAMPDLKPNWLLVITARVYGGLDAAAIYPPLFTGTIGAVKSDADRDDDGLVQKIITITGTDFVRQYANTTITEMISAANDAIEPGSELVGERINRILAELKDPLVKQIGTTSLLASNSDNLYALNTILYEL